MSTLPPFRLSFTPSGSTFPPDLYPELVDWFFQVPSYSPDVILTHISPKTGMSIFSTEHRRNMYGWTVTFCDLTKEKIENHVSIEHLVQTCKSMNVTVKSKLDIYKYRVMTFFTQNTVWAAQRFACKPYTDRTEMHRLWWPENRATSR